MKKKDRLTCEEARKINIQSVLIREGIYPTKETEIYAEYLSVFRVETKASFRVNKKINKWFDHGNGKGGNVIDLIVAWKTLTVAESLQFLNSELFSFSFQKQSILSKSQHPNFKIIKLCKIQNPALIGYLKSRKLNVDEAIKYCQEIHYTFDGVKTFFGISFRNNSDGFEVRNKYFKGCLINKNITSILNSSDTLVVFEGVIDHLSYRSLKLTELKEDYVILNSTSLVSQSITLLQKYKVIKTYLDNDNSGKNATLIIKDNCKTEFQDGSNLYKNYKDLNEYLIAITK